MNAAFKSAAKSGKGCTAKDRKLQCPGYGILGGHENCPHVFLTTGTKQCEITSAGVGVQPCHCEAVADEIVKLHLGNTLPWSQSDPRKWLRADSHWELAKIYTSALDGRPIDAETNSPNDYCSNKQQASDFAGDSLLNMGKMCAAFNWTRSQDRPWPPKTPVFVDSAKNPVDIDLSRWDSASDARNKVS